MHNHFPHNLYRRFTEAVRDYAIGETMRQCASAGFGSRHGRGSHGRGQHGGRRRMFESGELRLVLLKLIETQPRHGYDLIREIEALSGGAYAPSPGIVYPTLTLLGDMGLIVEREGDLARKIFEITEEGEAHLEAHKEQVEIALGRLEAMSKMSERTDGAPIRRAMQNLQTSLQQRLAEEGANRQTIFDVAALIDEAASKIERL